MGFKVLGISLILFGLILAGESKLWGRRLRQGEPCEEPGFFGDDTDCRKFYRCAEHPTDDENKPHLLRFAFRCPNGTVWDSVLETCNHPDAVLEKPEPCMPYDPEEPGQNMNEGNGENSDGSKWTTPSLFSLYPILQPQQLPQLQLQQVYSSQQQKQQPLILPVLYPSIGFPHGNVIQYRR